MCEEISSNVKKVVDSMQLLVYDIEEITRGVTHALHYRMKGSEKMTDAKALKIAMAMNGETQTELAHAIGLSDSQMSMRVNGKLSFSQEQITAITKHYNLTGDDVKDIFLK